ncbi:hypothetical protein LSH36_272g02038 [Paralvinella palmiformis]|uniref:Uncharacterized protein n=1 Tax=Paralvinella palmiformis TaxID=53620 RepID=A0AAD9JKT3_9ANNE|nr:hypothetical protein LSH36_272g02038 [Paralvinella palmiformis]
MRSNFSDEAYHSDYIRAENEEGSREDTKTSLGQQIQNRAQNRDTPRLAGLIRVIREENRVALDIVKKEDYDAWKMNKIRKIVKKKMTAKSYYAQWFSERSKNPPPAATVDDDQPLRRMKPAVSRPVMSSDLWEEDGQDSPDAEQSLLDNPIFQPYISNTGASEADNSKSVDLPQILSVSGQEGYPNIDSRQPDYRNPLNGQPDDVDAINDQAAEANPASAQPVDVSRQPAYIDSVSGLSHYGEPLNGQPDRTTHISEQPDVSNPIIRQPIYRNSSREQPNYVNPVFSMKQDNSEVQSIQLGYQDVIRVGQVYQQSNAPIQNEERSGSSPTKSVSPPCPPSVHDPVIIGNKSRPFNKDPDSAPVHDPVITKEKPKSLNKDTVPTENKQISGPKRLIRNPITGRLEEVEVKGRKKRSINKKDEENSAHKSQVRQEKIPAVSKLEDDKDNILGSREGLDNPDKSRPAIRRETNLVLSKPENKVGVRPTSPEVDLSNQESVNIYGDDVASRDAESITNLDQTIHHANIQETATSRVGSRESTVLVTTKPRYRRGPGMATVNQTSPGRIPSVHERVPMESDLSRDGRPPISKAMIHDRMEDERYPSRNESLSTDKRNPRNPDVNRKLVVHSQFENAEPRDPHRELSEYHPEKYGSNPQSGGSYPEPQILPQYTTTPTGSGKERVLKFQSKSDLEQLRHRSSPASDDAPTRDRKTLTNPALRDDKAVVYTEPKLKGTDKLKTHHPLVNSLQSNHENGRLELVTSEKNGDGTTSNRKRGDDGKRSVDDEINNKVDTEPQDEMTPVETPRRFTVYHSKSSVDHKPPPRRSFLATYRDPEPETTNGRTTPAAGWISPRAPKGQIR